MKTLKIIIIVLFLLFILCAVGILIFLKTFDLNKYKPQITAELTKVLGRGVTIEFLKLEVSPQKGAIINVGNLTIADNPNFSKDDFVSVKSIDLGVDLKAYLSQKKVLVSSVIVRSPRVNIIKNENGVINAATIQVNIPKQKTQVSFKKEEDLSGLAFAATPSVSQPPLSLLIQSFKINDGFLSYKDLSFKPPLDIPVSSLQLNASNVSLTEPFNFELTGSVFSPKENINIAGSMVVDIVGQGANLSDVKVSSDLSDISLDRALAALPMLKDAGIKEGLQGKVTTTLSKVTVGAKGMTTLLFDGKIQDGFLKIKSLPIALGPAQVNFEGNEKDVVLKDSILGLGQGKISLNGKISDYLKEQRFDLKAQISGVDIQEINPSKESVQMQGKLQGQFDVQGQGLNGSTEMLSSIAANGTINVTEPKLVGMNVLKLVLDKMSMLPNLVEKVEGNLPEKYKNSLKSQDTAFKKIVLNAKVADRKIILKNADVEAETFALSTQGTVSLSQELELKSAIIIPSDLSKSMAQSAEGLQYIFDGNGQILIPLTIAGKIPNLIFIPDLQYLGQKIIVNRGAEMLEGVLKKALGQDEENPQTQTPGSGTTPQSGTPSSTTTAPKEKKSPEKQLIEGVLDQIFKK